MLNTRCSRGECAVPQVDSPEVELKTPSNLMELIEGIKTDKGPRVLYAAERRLQDALLNKFVSITANGEEFKGLVVEVRIEVDQIIIDFAGGYFAEATKDQITDLSFTTKEEANAYCEALQFENQRPIGMGPIRRRINEALQN